MRISLSDEQSIGFQSRKTETGRTWSLASLFSHLLTMAENNFGPRDMSWTPVGIEIGEGADPYSWYPGGFELKRISIVLGCDAATNWKQAAFQLAHETVHVLAPVLKGEATVAEEGTAVIFSDEISLLSGWAYQTADPKYLEAKALVTELLKVDAAAIRKIRTATPHFSEWTPSMIQMSAPGLNSAVADALCQKFSR